ncbi:MAG: REP-associated tyrosine transposase [Terriglobia bacterium]
MGDFLRKRNRLLRTTYVGRRWYFVTLCTRERRLLFRERKLVNVVLGILKDSCGLCDFDVYAYCFMPDHLHIELIALSESSDLAAFMRNFKGRSAAEARRLAVRNLWQKGYYDHVLREGENEKAVAWYIFNNPVRKGLVQGPLEWPFAGSWVLDWKRAVAPPEIFVPSWRPRNVMEGASQV